MSGTSANHASVLSVARMTAQPTMRDALCGSVPRRIIQIAEAGAAGAALTGPQIIEICEALRAQHRSVRNHFHTST